MNQNPYAPGGFNPYQPPSVAADFGPGAAPTATNYWREGDLLVVNKGASLPLEVCVATGGRSDGKPVHKKLQWAHPAVAVAIVVNILLYLILYMVLRKTGELTYAFSPEFRGRRRNGILIAVLGPIGCMILAGVSVEIKGFEWLSIIAMLGLLATIIVGIFMAQPFRIQKIDEHRIYLKVKPAVFSALGL